MQARLRQLYLDDVISNSKEMLFFTKSKKRGKKNDISFVIQNFKLSVSCIYLLVHFKIISTIKHGWGYPQISPQKKIPQKTRIFGPNILFLAPFHLFLPFWVHCRPDLMQKHNFLPFQVQCGGLFYLFLMGATLLFSSAPPNLGSESESPNPKPNFKKGRASNSSRCH